MTEDIIVEFILFLSNERCLERFKQLVQKEYPDVYTIADYVRLFEKETNIFTDIRECYGPLIGYAFTWATTKEKDYYWRLKSAKWDKIMGRGGSAPFPPATKLACKSIW